MMPRRGMGRTLSAVGGGEKLGGDNEPWFPVKITAELTTGTTGLDVTSYTGVEIWIDGKGNAIEKVGGRVLGNANPGVPLDPTTTFAADDLALARSAPGAGGLLWELVPYAAAAGGDPPAGSTTCKAFGWLLSGPRSNKVWRVRVSEAIGQCADCTTVDPAFDGTNDRIAYWDSSPAAGQEIWEVAGNLVLCGGCATARILTNRNATTPAARAQLEVTYKSAADGSTVTKTFDAECTPDDGTVVWAVAADDLCPEPTDGADYPCASLIRVTAECIACDKPNVACTKCLGQEGPPVFKVVGSGFTDVNEVYNGTWYPKWSSGCTWTVTCGGVTVSVVVDCTKVTVTYSGGGGGGATYEYDNITGIYCFGSNTATRTVGDELTTATDVTFTARSCSSGGTLSGLTITMGLVCGTGGLTDWPMNNSFSPDAMDYTAGPGDGTCPSFGILVQRQADGRFRVSPVCNNQVDCVSAPVCYAGGPVLILDNEVAWPSVQLTFDWEVDCCGTPGTVSILIHN